ncbi:unnamed protein product [Brassicogethes aeneus]|uniref:Protein stoned-B n=1 Tax=Brassicogethes aeneus TaxID=1431903 RepID=A0A9P0FKX6_BRAAE|nr:unnamed protein product [Brassicogethes aeneus]
MDVKNPFLFTEDEYTSPPMASNPFLLEGDDYQDGNTTMDNPFLSQTATSVSTNSTNPFAFDPMDLDPAEGEVPQEPTNAFMGYTSASQPSFFMNEPVTVTASSQDFFSTAQDVIVTTTPAQKPTDLDLKYTNDVANGGPTRPPPPRPPPSKETQDLLMSVMGAMDATSSHLLDKIPPTRTPSPVNMRDLHSPSPTPDATFGDLLDVSDAKTQPQNFTNVTNTDEDFLSLGNDVNQNPPEPEAVVPPMPQRPPEPVRAPPPMRPQPPVRPPRPQPPAIAQEPPKKPPPPRAAPPAVAAKPAQDDFDMFGEGPKPPATNADILNLYNAPKEERVRDLLFDNVEPEVNAEINVVESEKEISPVQTQEIKESSSTFISPEVTQNDLQMDTSDSQSKGSVSSVTFNPFATTEDNVSPVVPPVGPQDLTPLENNVFQQDVTPVSQPMDIFGTTQLVSNANAYDYPQPHQQSIFLSEPEPIIQDNFYSDNQTTDEPKADAFSNFGETNDEFDAFAQKFDSVAKDENRNGAFDSFGEGGDAWGNTANEFESSAFGNDSGFGNEESFDAFLALQEPPVVPQSTPNRVSKAGSQESDEEKDFSVFIRPKTNEDFSGGVMPVIAPPPAHVQAAFTDTSPRFNPFDQSEMATTQQADPVIPYGDGEMKRSDSAETPPTPLFDEDVSQPLEPFPRINFEEEGWEMHLRQPNKKKITGQRFWKKIWVCLSYQPDCVLLQLYNLKGDKDPFQELPLQPCYSVSDIGAQQYDQFGKIFTVKLQYIFYKERPGVRPGQVKKAERITNKLSQFAAYAIQGDYQGVKEFGSDLKKLGLPVEHAPQVSQLMKLGSLNYEDLKQFSFSIEEALFKLQAHRDRALQYKMEEVQITAVDELYVEQDSDGHIERQIARVRLFFLGFLTGMPDIELGVNDMRRQGKEVVGRHDIIPVVTEEWIRLENIEFHNCIQQEEWERNHIIRFKPPDACYIELMRFRVRPPKNRELPLQLKAQICVTGTRVEMKADVLVPGFASRKLGQIPCEDVMIRFPIPECWIYLFRVEKHFRYGSVKSAHRRTGKIKGIERILGTVDTLQENLIEVTSGQAKYEHQHRAIVWRCPRLPKEGQGAYTTHNMVCKIALTSYDQMPEKLAEYCHVEFTMPATQVSHMTCRSVSLQNSDSDEPPEKYVRYLARHEYRVGIEHTEGENPNAYAAATFVSKPKEAPIPEKPAPVAEESSSDSD